MNYIITSILSVFFMLMSILSVPFNELENAFSKGDATRVINYGTAKMLISIEGKEGVYSRSQGTQVLSSFFKSNPPKSFSFSFKGKDEGASTFAVGDYQSNKKYRVSIKFKKIQNEHQIESLTIASFP
ncbi:MAG TPA: DUF4783 domain-containing protein [Brumimicrobium sp.]|nr:DUF4783 domain-containing protein [Brumimicrobium sp.]